MTEVSILMNGYNSEKYLKETIDSVYNQTFDNWEIIFIDNCSTDDTKKIVDMYDEKIKYYKTEQTVALGKARNWGLQFCTGKYLAFLDTDDIWLPNKLNQQLEIMQLDERYQMCYTGVIYIDENSNEITRFMPVAKSGNVFPQQLRKYEINMQSVLIRNNIDIKFNESMQVSPDFDLFMKISSQYLVYVKDSYLVKYRKLTNSLSTQKMNRWWIEIKSTLDDIFLNNIDFQEKYSEECKMAYAKVFYNKARYLIETNKKAEASDELSKVKFLNLTYFGLYIISFLPKNVWFLIHKYKNKL